MTLGEWIGAARPRTLTASVVPVGVGLACAARAGRLDEALALVTLGAALSIQLATNLCNDWGDARRGADGPDRVGPARLSGRDPATARAVGRAAAAALVVATLLGAVLVWRGGWPILLVGVASLLSAVAYTAGPFPLAYHGLGDLFVFVFFGPVAVGGTYLLQRGAPTAAVLAASVPVGLLAVAILVVNNLRDIETDRQAGKRTLGVVMGDAGTRRWFVLLLLVAWIAMAAATFAGVEFAVAAVIASVALSLRLLRPLRAGVSGRALNPVLKATARFHLLSSVAWAAAIVVSR